MSIVDMRDFLAARYSRNWVKDKTDDQVLRIYYRILAQEEERRNKKHAESH